MKNKLALLVGSLMLVGMSAHAEKFSSEDIAELPVLTEPKVVVKMPSKWTPVQPFAHVKFKYKSCAERTFKAEVAEQGNVMIVAIADLSKADCRSVGVVREYSVQISSDMNPNTAVSLLNPVETEKQ